MAEVLQRCVPKNISFWKCFFLESLNAPDSSERHSALTNPARHFEIRKQLCEPFHACRLVQSCSREGCVECCLGFHVLTNLLQRFWAILDERFQSPHEWLHFFFLLATIAWLPFTNEAGTLTCALPEATGITFESSKQRPPALALLLRISSAL